MKKKLIFLIGVEGTGHHLISASINYKQTKQAHELIAKAFDTFSSPEELEQNKNKLREFLINYPQEFRHIESASFPFARPFNPLRRYDILEIKILLDSIPELDWGFLVLTRNPVDSTFSSWKRFDANNESRSLFFRPRSRSISLYEAAKAQEANILYIQSQLLLIDSAKYLVLSYEDMCQHPEKITDLIKTKLEIEDVNVDSSKIYKRIKRKESFEIKFLEKFFTPTRLSQFNKINSLKANFT